MYKVEHAGRTFSPTKVQLAQSEVMIVGKKCTPQGCLSNIQKVEKILIQLALKSVKDVHAFLELYDTVRVQIENYSVKVQPFTELTQQETEFI